MFWSLGSFENFPKETSEAWRMQLGVCRSLEGPSTLSRLGLEGLLLFMYSNLLTSGSISTWRVAERFFAKFFGFLFDYTSWRYLVFASLLPYFCALLLLFVVHVYVLEYLSVICTHLLLFRT